MKIWIIQSNEPVEGSFMNRSIQKDVGAGAMALTELWERKVLVWKISSSGEIREQMEHHQSAMTYHRGARLFWWDGGINGHIKNPQFLGYGDGSRTDYFLPYRWVYRESLIMSVNYAIEPGWTLNSATGLVRFSVAPADGALIHADEFRCRFKAFFVINSDVMYKMTDNFKSYASDDIIIREHTY